MPIESLMSVPTMAESESLRLSLRSILQLAHMYGRDAHRKHRRDLDQFIERLQPLATTQNAYSNGNLGEAVIKLVDEWKTRFPENGLIVSLVQAVEDEGRRSRPLTRRSRRPLPRPHS